MKKFTLVLACLAIQLSYSQVSIHKNRLVKNETEYKFSKYEEVFSNAEAKAYFKKARANKTTAEILSYTGGFGVGFSLAQIIGNTNNKTYGSGPGSYTIKTDNSVRWTVFGISAGVALLSIPFYTGYVKNSEKAIQIENGETTAFQPYYKLETTGNGFALSYNF